MSLFNRNNPMHDEPEESTETEEDTENVSFRLVSDWSDRQLRSEALHAALTLNAGVSTTVARLVKDADTILTFLSRPKED